MTTTVQLHDKPRATQPLVSTKRETSPDSASNFIKKTAGHEKTHVILHSFAAWPLGALVAKCSESISRLTLITPVFDMLAVQKNILVLAANDFLQAQRVEEHRLISECLTKSTGFFDSWIEKGLTVALNDAALLAHYWQYQKIRDLYFSYFAHPNYQFDPDCFFEVQRGARDRYRECPMPISKIPIHAIFGARDPVVKEEEQVLILRENCPEAKVQIFEDCGHYPHLESPERFVQSLF